MRGDVRAESLRERGLTGLPSYRRISAEPISVNSRANKHGVPFSALVRARVHSRREVGVMRAFLSAFVVMRWRDLEHFVESGDAGRYLHCAADTQGFHAVLVSLLADLAEVGILRDESLDRRR